MKGKSEVEIKPANLWSKVKAQCLNKNEYIGENDDGQTVVKCPRCEKWELDQNYTTLSVAPGAIEWAVPVQKCTHCSHLFAFCR